MGETLPPQWRRNLIQVVPMLITLALILVAAAPAQTSTVVPVTPMLALMSIFYWSVYRPGMALGSRRVLPRRHRGLPAGRPARPERDPLSVRLWRNDGTAP